MRVDPEFAALRQNARSRQRRGRIWRLGPLAVIGVAAVGWGGWHLSQNWPMGKAVADDAQLVQVEEQFQIAPVVHADAFTNIPGDPMLLPAAEDAQTAPGIPGPQGLSPNRAGPPGPERLTLVAEPLYARDRRLMTALPTSREDFALFQSQRAKRARPDALAPVSAPAPIDPLANPDAGVLSDNGDSGSNTIYMRASTQRQAAWQDLVLAVDVPTPLATVLTTHGWDSARAGMLATRAVARLPALAEPLPAGSILAIRWQADGSTRRLLQMSVYGPKGYEGTLAETGSDLISASDPWLGTDLRALAGVDKDGGAGQFRLLDAIYSAALRKGVPTETVAEVIALMSRVYDLDAVASEGDRITLVLARNPPPDAPMAAGVLFVGIDGPSGSKACYVVPDDGQEGYRCFAPGARVAVSTLPQLDAPVEGKIQRRFGQDGATGVDWTVSPRSEVASPGAGRVASVQAADGLQTVTIDHGAGFMSRITAVMDLDRAVVQDALIAKGATVGRVGKGQGDVRPTVTLALMSGGQAVDPMPAMTGGHVVLASDAVEQLIGRIIHVESGGNARAKNPLSSATGLGQFIDSTWMRMMSSYRPDLVATMTRGQLLELRFDPGTSREMVKHLAQENEAYLRARGHAITSGRLYLAHFLGPEGANIVLSAPADASIAALMGPGVVRANPFLAGYSSSQLAAWADRKMSGSAVSGAVPATAAPEPVSPAVQSYVAVMDSLLKAQAAASSG
ncbi:MAG: hypothetical protein DI498_00180 [Paracoccus denitrificans]|nr:MAG: hypothetical protein DI498_00180 [Paracoccus denitrificans]PZO86192.1 MAG: hypothetical protein DI633_00180 [Paracoccus denitrificans]